jgi:hypothetical protein
VIGLVFGVLVCQHRLRCAQSGEQTDALPGNQHSVYEKGDFGAFINIFSPVFIFFNELN